MIKIISLLTCIYALGLTRYATLVAKQGARKRHREPLRALSGLLALGAAIVFILATLQGNESQASNNKLVITHKKLHVIDYQIYTLKQLRSVRQFNCAVILWTRESNWRPEAHTGTHYGIVQGTSRYLKTASAYKQIDWGIKYVGNRYGYDHGVPNLCAALAHSYSHWWY
jgi:hypothetical protein